jgi:hypothetical protein
MPQYLRHRYLVYLPFAVFLLGTVVAGQLNGVDARGTVIDMSTREPVPDVPVIYGGKRTLSDATGHYELLGLPRGARISASPRFSYSAQSVAAEATTIELPPITMNLQVNQRNVVPSVGVKSPQARQGDKVLGTGTETGSMVIVPYPEVGSKILICADGYASVEIEARGVQKVVEMVTGGTGCPPLPSPSPRATPSASPSGSPAGSPSATPSASPTP